MAQAPLPVGGEFEINSYTTGNQVAARLAMAPDGGFVVVWQSAGAASGDTSFYSIQGQRHAADGSALGPQFEIDSFTTGNQFAPAAAFDAVGGFVVVWESQGSPGTDLSDYSIQGRRFDANGVALGAQFQVNSYTTSTQTAPALAVAPGGGFVVAWTSLGSNAADRSEYSVQGQRFDAAGAALGSQFEVNTYTTLTQWLPSVAADAAGNFIVAWASRGSDSGDTSSYSIQGQRYDNAGNATGAQFEVNSFTPGAQTLPVVGCASTGGGFVVAWASQGSAGGDTSGYSIQSRRFDANGVPRAAQVQVNSDTLGAQFAPAVAVAPNGDFVVAWTSQAAAGGPGGLDTSGTGVRARRFADGAPQGDDFEVNLATTGYQTGADVALAADGRFVVTWQSESSAGPDVSGYSIEGRRFRASDLLVDGFEAGDTNRWSQTVP